MKQNIMWANNMCTSQDKHIDLSGTYFYLGKEYQEGEIDLYAGETILEDPFFYLCYLPRGCSETMKEDEISKDIALSGTIRESMVEPWA